ncbi:aspartic peptidase domain-containing protein [Limtongia smithiae]|uniref:aspartic peptidase domain-containing protein n=1 Tax=Limtongia smithiae TaxID=1125753 RepID=UPI0034CFB97C
MKPTLIFSALALAAAASVSATPVVHARAPAPYIPAAGAVSFPIRAPESPATRMRRRLRRRKMIRMLQRRGDSTAEVSITNDYSDGAYLATVTLGTPAQSVELQVDTGSADLWVESSSNSDCSDNACSTTGSFNSSASSTYSDSSTADFSITYADGSTASGAYVQDTLKISNVTITDFTFGLATSSSTSTLGVLGVGFDADEAATTTYENLPDRLYSDGAIAVKAYSLWLNDADASEGTLLFGGIDTDKYTGDLQTIDIVATSGSTYTQFEVEMTKFVYNDAGNSTTMSSDTVDVVLDSGTTYAVLPTELVESLASAMDSTEYDEDYGVYIVDCTLQDSTTKNVTLTFGSSANFTVGLSSLVVTLEYSVEGSTETPTLCALGIETYTDSSDSGASTVQSSTTYILGDAFLRAGYFVFDLTNKQVSVAQAVFDTTASSITALSSGGVSGSSETGTGSTGSSSSSSAAGRRKVASAVAVGVAMLVGVLVV